MNSSRWMPLLYLSLTAPLGLTTACSSCGPGLEQTAHPDQFAKQLDDLKARGKLDQGSYDLIQWYRVRAGEHRLKGKSINALILLSQKQLQADAANWSKAKEEAQKDLQGLLSVAPEDFPGLAVTSDRSSAQAIARLIRPKQIVALLDEQLIAFDSEPKDYYKVVPVLPRTVDKVALAVWQPLYNHVAKRAGVIPESLRRRQEQESLPGLSRYLSQVKELDAGERTRLELHLSLLAAMAYRAPSTTEKSQAPWVIAYRAWKACGDGKTSLELKRLTLATRAYRDRLSAAPGDPRQGLALLQARAAIDAVTQRCNQGKPKSK
ncbi:MAG TPA: hypothetical protein DEB46_05200 [Myxococcales bacterium]|nr:hypothetical protein [Myxococcales bacterium]